MMAYNQAIESFRDEEYPMMKNKTYLDHAGTTLYARSLIDNFSQNMISNLYGNPHSASDPAKLSSQSVKSVREQTLLFLGADPDHFDLVFTANATAAIKLVSESFRDLASVGGGEGSFRYKYHVDSHTSLVGIREYTNGHHLCLGSDKEVEDWLSGQTRLNIGQDNEATLGLFAYPGQSNMTGRRLPLSWPAKLRSSSQVCGQNTYSLLDAAALATTSPLNAVFSDPNSAPDFTALSFYKIFGFPDVGALVVRKASGHVLSWRKYFGGGTVSSLTVLHEATYSRKNSTIHDGLEDGTLQFHSIVALGCAIDVHRRLYGSMNEVSRHTSFLSQRLFEGLFSLRHVNGQALCIIYLDSLLNAAKNPYSNPKTQGATIAFNILKSSGTYIGYSKVEKLANDKGIYLRSGGLCNPGGIANHLKIEPWQFKRAWSAGHSCDREDGMTEVICGKPMGVVRASLGAMSTVADVDRLVSFMRETFIEMDEMSREEDGIRDEEHSKTEEVCGFVDVSEN